MLSAPPTPIRPPCRTRRRSSSFSTFSSSSSPATDDPWTHSPTKRGSRPDGKRARRADFRGGDSPLKQSQPLFAPIEYPESAIAAFWTQPSPFSAAPASSCTAMALAPHAPPPPPSTSTSTSLFSATARDFSLPSAATTSSSNAGWQRARHASAESTFFAPSSISSSPGSSGGATHRLVFEDSSFSSSHSSRSSASSSSFSPPHSLPSASTSPSSGLFTFSCAPHSTSSATLPPPALRRASSCHSPLFTPTSTAMVLDSLPSAADEAQATAAVVQEAERLHHVAFEQLRSATRADGEGFVERMRRWEAEQQQGAEEMALEGDDDASEADDDADALDLCQDENEVELTLDLGGFGVIGGGASPPAVSASELDDLARRLRGGACELEDFALVREVQARGRSQGRARA
ncbi:hypothetical protein JCM6882_005669 [Rhodosporidiobolus microsporus]